MTPRRLRITGPADTPYRLGDPISVYDETTLLATLDPVPLSADGSEVHLEHFQPTDLVRTAQVHVGRLIFLEICEFLSENFHQVQAIRFVFTRRVDIPGGGSLQAGSRVEMMARIGATEVKVTPKSDQSSAHFIVSGVWLYNERNLQALRIVLAEERQRYLEWVTRGPASADAGLLGTLQRLIRREK